MNRLFKFNYKYFLLAAILFAIEICIALFMHDKIIRPYIGDVLVVILIYCFVKAFFKTPVVSTAIAVLLFSFLVETAQYFNIVKVLGLQHSKLATIVIGSSFGWMDLVAYTAGIVIVVAVEKIIAAVQSKSINNTSFKA